MTDPMPSTTAPAILETADDRRLAYHKTEGSSQLQAAGKPGVVFLGGFRSDMTGTKAVHLEAWATRTGRAFLRFDYSGHGQSSEDFLDGAIGDWAADAFAAVSALTEGPQILVGSSMGGWISLLLARRAPERVAGFVGVAAAPDFTEDSMWAGFGADERRALEIEGLVRVPSEYSDEPDVITRRLIEDGRRHLVLRHPLHLPFPVRLLHGTADADVDVSVALRLLAHATSPDMRLTLVKDADHRFSAPADLDLITATLDALA